MDSSVWIDFFCNKPTPHAEWFDRNIDIEGLVVGDLILVEVFDRAAVTIAGVQLLHRVRKNQPNLGRVRVEGRAAPAI